MIPTRPPRLCPACHLNHAAWTTHRVDFCYRCLPGGPFTPPPCASCGSDDYFSQGLCERCHLGGPDYLDSCRDCLDWGVKRQYAWRCWKCRDWKSHCPAGDCPYCGRIGIPIGDLGACRMCFQHAKNLKEPGAAIDLQGANAHGQQLMFANLLGPKKRKPRNNIYAPAPRKPAPVQAFTPVRWRQEPLSYLRPSTLALRLAATAPHPGMQAHLDTVLDEHAAAHGWSVRQINAVRHTLRVLLTLQATPGSPIRASEVTALSGEHGNHRRIHPGNPCYCRGTRR